MKTKLYFAALALPLAFGACTNDDFETVSPNQGANGELVEVGPGFAISASKAGGDAATRGMWIEAMNGTKKTLNYAWWPNYVLNETGTGYDAVRDEIGLCWVGQSVGTNVYTNYRFQHAGWLNEDETTAEIDPCEPHEILNGYELKNDLSWGGTPADRYKLKDGNKLKDNALELLEGQYKAEGNQYLATIGGQSRNLNSAFFRTPSETLFKGDYIAYLPFTPEMTEAGAVLAHSPKDVTVVLDETAANEAGKNIRYAHLGSDMFMYAYAPGLVGGTQASNFAFKHLSGLIRVKAKADFSHWNNAGDEGLSGITSITLVDAAGKFVTEVGLDASKIVAEGNSASTGTALYVPGTEKYTNMLTAHIDNNNSKVVQNQTSEISIYIPALPTTTGQVSIVLYNHDLKLSAVYELNASSIQVKPGQVTTIDMGMIDIEDFTEKVATTEKALYQMAGTNGTEKDGSIIRLMGDIELGTLTSSDANEGDKNASTLNTGWNLKKAVTLNGGEVIVPTNFEWTIGSDATINSDIEIENQGCCDGKNGKLKIGTNNNNQKTTLNGTIDNYGDIVFEQNSATVATKNVTTITGKLNNHETLVPETGKTNYANITINPLTEVNLEGATVVNDAEFTIEAEGENASDNDGLLTLDKNASITNNYYLTNAGNINNGGKINNEAEGWIIDRISSQFGLNPVVNNGGQYVCEVNGQTRLDRALSAKMEKLTTRVRIIGFSNEMRATENTDMAKNLYDAKDANFAKGAKYGDETYANAAFDISGINRPNVDFEIDKRTYTNGEAIRLYSKSGNSNEGAGQDVKIGKLIITKGSLDVPNFVKWDGKKYVDATFEVKSIIVDGEKAYASQLQGKNITVNQNVEVLQMKDEKQALTFGGIKVGTSKTYELTNVKVGGNYIVGSNEKKEVAGTAFNNNNTTDIKGSFSLYENGSCDIKVATATGIDNWGAYVSASGLAIDLGKWLNGNKIVTGEHPLWDAK